MIETEALNFTLEYPDGWRETWTPPPGATRWSMIATAAKLLDLAGVPFAVNSTLDLDEAIAGEMITATGEHTDIEVEVDVKPFTCHVCGTSTDTAEAFSDHVLTVHPERAEGPPLPEETEPVSVSSPQVREQNDNRAKPGKAKPKAKKKKA